LLPGIASSAAAAMVFSAACLLLYSAIASLASSVSGQQGMDLSQNSSGL